MSRRHLPLALMGVLALVVVVGAAAKTAPSVIPLPTGWQPEGIEAGKSHTLYVGSVATGAVRQIDARSTKSFTLVQPISGRSATGLEFDGRRLYVAGGGTGHGYVYDARTGAPVTDYAFATAPTFINDVVLTRNTLYFTDSNKPQLYSVRVGGAQSDVKTIPLTGDYVHAAGFNLNGIVATRDGRSLIAVQTNTASLFKIDPATGVAKKIALTGGDAANGDGLLLVGRTLYVVQNQLNRIAVVKLAGDLTSGTIVAYLTNPAFDVPTTIDKLNGRLYLPNARFGTADPANAHYEVVSLKPRS